MGALELGVLHPPGYPLFSLLTSLWVRIPLGSVAFRLNCFAAALGAAAAVLLYVLWRRMGSEEKWLGAGAVLFAVLSASFWSQATVAKGGIYMLNVLATAGILACFFVRGEGTRVPLFGALVFGLALAHHWMSVVGLLPGVVWLAARGKPEGRMKRLALAGGMAVMGASLYLYMPLRAAAGPFLNWGDPDSAGRLWFVLGRRQYMGSLSDTAMAGVAEKMGYAAGALSGAAPWALLAVLAAAGAWVLSRVNPRAELFTLLYMVSIWTGLALVPIRQGTPWFLEIYSMPVTVLLVLHAAIGLKSAVSRFAGGLPAAAALAAAGLVLALPQRWFSADRSREFLTWDLALNLEASAPERGLLFANSDAVVFGNWHRQFVSGGSGRIVCIPAPLLPMPWVSASFSRLLPRARVPVPDGEAVPVLMRAWVMANRGRFAFYAFLTDSAKTAFGRQNMGAHGLLWRLGERAEAAPLERLALGRLRWRGVFGSEMLRERRKAEAVRPLYFGGLLAYANRHLKEDPEGARRIFVAAGRVAQDRAGRALVELGLGNAAVGKGLTQEAIGHYERAAREDPSLATAMRNMAMLLLKEKRPKEALRAMRKVKEEAPFSEEAEELAPFIRQLEKSVDFR